MRKLVFQIAFFLSSPRLTAALLFYCVLFIFLATLEIPSIGIANVQAKYFESWFCMFGFLPLAGGITVGIIAICNLIASAFRFGARGIAGVGFATIHIALVLLILSGFLQSLWRAEGIMVLQEGAPSNAVLKSSPDGETKERETLPFSVELVKFTAESWLNTDLPRQYSSLVKFNYEKISQEKLIKMNEPASFGSWTFYQSSFADGGKVSVLQAVHNPAGLMPWIAIMLIFAGMVFTYAYKFFAKQ